MRWIAPTDRSFIRRTVPYRTEDHRIGGVVITMVDISTLRQRERQLRASEEKLLALTKNLESQVRERTELLEILQHVTRLANEATSIDEALQFILLRKSPSSMVGTLAMCGSSPIDSSPDDQQLESSGIWHITADANNSTANEKLHEFQRITARTRFSKGDGLVGRAMQSGQPEWVNDICEQPDTFRCSISGLVLHAAIAIPITIGSEVVAVMEFFSDQTIETRQFLEIIPDIGIQLGHAIGRNRLEKIVASIADAEQRRIGRELHDGIAQQLTGGALIAQSLAQYAA